MDPSRALLIALNRCETLSRDSICRLAPHLELLREDRMGAAELSQTSKVTPRQLERALDARSSAEETAECEQRRAQSLGFEILTTLDPTYPTPLRDLELPPPVVYVEGELPRRPGFSIVSSRAADAYGLEAAELFSRVLSATGLAIVSRLARGIDGCAHENAVDVEGGRSIAVLACGLDHTYPLQHRALRRRLATCGAVISEFPLGTRPVARNFPIRNRLIAALGCGCLVVQATVRSGSQITARLALDLGRDVFAVPGGIFDRRSKGTNALIRDGALVALHPTEVAEALPLRIKELLADRAANPATADTETSPTGNTGWLLAALTRGKSYSAESLARLAGLELPRVQALLVELGIDGRLRRHPGALYSQRSSRAL